MSSTIVGITELKQYLGISVSTYDTVLTELESAYEDIVREYCGRQFTYGTYSQSFNIRYDYTDQLVLDEYPVSSVVALTDNETLLTEGSTEDYVVDTDIGLIYRVDSDYFTTGADSVNVCYVAGMTSDYSSGLKLAIKKLVSEEMGKRTNVGLQSEVIGSYRYVLRSRRVNEIFPPDVEIILSQYKRAL